MDDNDAKATHGTARELIEAADGHMPHQGDGSVRGSRCLSAGADGRSEAIALGVCPARRGAIRVQASTVSAP